ncbi:hypothetical protein D3Z62_24565 [Lachnospiraceae bacterium]|nr:hypothetical protein [Lachnospiraceae bacterium]
MSYKIMTKIFERILLSMQHITQRIQKGKKCVVTLKYDPDKLFTEISNFVQGKKKLNYEIRTEGFEEILLSMQQITKQIRIGEKCVVIVEYNPNAYFTKIQTVIEQSSGMEANQERDL